VNSRLILVSVRLALAIYAMASTACLAAANLVPLSPLDLIPVDPGYTCAPENGLVCESAEEAAKQKREREAHDHAIVSQGRALTRLAATAARDGDCVTVEMIEQQVLALPDAHIEGGIHDVIFLQDAEIVRYVATRRAFHVSCRKTPRPECEPPPPALPPEKPRELCVAEREALFARILGAAAPAQRAQLLATHESCAAATAEAQAHEQAWALTWNAADGALHGNCAAALELAAEVTKLDAEHYEFVFSREPDISQCFVEAARRRADRERCLRDRSAAQLRAQQITDLAQRGKALLALPQCR
jgi:hypothetical protein